MTPTTNANLLQDLKQLQTKGGEISTAAAIQLILGSLISLEQNMNKLSADLECNADSAKEFQITLTKRVDDLTTQVSVLAKEVKENRDAIEIVARQTENWCLPNPMLGLGCFMKNNPKLFLGLATAGMALLLLMSIPQVKHSLIIFLGFPKEFASFLAPIP